MQGTIIYVSITAIKRPSVAGIIPVKIKLQKRSIHQHFYIVAFSSVIVVTLVTQRSLG